MVGLIIAARIMLAAHPAMPAPQGRVVVTLAARQHDVSVVTTSQGIRYNATDKAGRALASNATLAELKQQCPDAYRLIEPALCDAGGVPTIILDARD